MEDPTIASTLPHAPLLNILVYLNLEDLYSISTICKHWSSTLYVYIRVINVFDELHLHFKERGYRQVHLSLGSLVADRFFSFSRRVPNLWREMCLKMEVELPDGTQDYEKVLREWATQFAGLRAYYPRVRSLYLRLVRELMRINRLVLNGLTTPVKRTQFDELCSSWQNAFNLDVERPLDVLPPEVSCWYLMTDAVARTSRPLFGVLDCYDIMMTAHPLPFLNLGSSYMGGAEHSILIAKPYIRLALADTPQFKRGNVWISQPTWDGENTVPTPSIGLIVADSWLNYIENYVMMLENGILGAHRRFGILKWPQKGIPEAITNDLKVTAAHVHHPATASPRYLFLYYITLSMDANITGRNRSKLVSRHWKITDLNEQQSDVHGPGVIGEFPEIGPGDSFSYSSCCPLPTPGGTMEGYFIMQDMVTQDFWRLTVPQMTFQTQRTITAQTIAAHDFQTS